MASASPFALPHLAGTARLRDFITDFGALLDRRDDEATILAEGGILLADLVADDDWLPDAYAVADPVRYRQYLLHCDSRERFSVVSFVWGPGQATPIHDHRVWGLVGVLRGAEISERFARSANGALRRLGEGRIDAGQIDPVSPRLGDIHRVSNAHADRVSISIHVYGANIGAVERATYDAASTAETLHLGLCERHAAQHLGPLAMTRATTPQAVRRALLLRREIALLDLRHEARFATAHPLFAANLAHDRIDLEAEARLPRKDVPIVLYDDGEGLVAEAAARLAALGYADVTGLEGGLSGWRAAGYELFQDVNSYSKAFGELVEARRHTPSLAAGDVAAMIEEKADIAILDARRFEEYATMNIPGSTSVPGAELVLRACDVAPDPDTLIIVNCAGRTRSIIGTQSLINAGVPNRVVALRNGTIGWTLAGRALQHGADRRAAPGTADEARAKARAVAYRAGVRHITPDDAAVLATDSPRTLYRFDVRSSEDYAAGHIAGFRHYPGGQLVQETDVAAPVRGARLLLADDIGVRADMTASWLSQMGWEVYVLAGGFDGALETGAPPAIPPPDPAHRYKRPYEGTDNAAAAMQAYLDWEYGLVDQLARDATHGFFVI